MAYTVTNNPWSSQYSVGIGTDSPTELLEIANTSTNDVKIRFLETGVSDSFLMLDASEDWLGFSADGSNHHLGIHTATGHVGIGTPSPSFPLEIVQASTQSCIYIDNNSDAGNSGISYNGTGARGPAIYAVTDQGSDQGDPFVWLIADNTGFDQAIIHIQNDGTGAAMVTTAGKVGFGTTSPVSPLNVVSGSTVVDRTLSLDNTTANLNNGVGIAFRSKPNATMKTLAAIDMKMVSNASNVGDGDLIFYTATDDTLSEC
jgi:hypothetical protein